MASAAAFGAAYIAVANRATALNLQVYHIDEDGDDDDGDDDDDDGK